MKLGGVSSKISLQAWRCQVDDKLGCLLDLTAGRLVVAGGVKAPAIVRWLARRKPATICCHTRNFPLCVWHGQAGVASGVLPEEKSVTRAGERPATPSAPTSRRWQLSYGAPAINWMRSSGVAQRMLADVCRAVETTIAWEVGDNQAWARRVIERFPAVRAQCDQLRFSDPAQALAYLILHVPDRYCRMFHVLERLLATGRLPIGKRDDFAANALLAYYARLHHPEVRIAPLSFRRCRGI